MSECNLGEEGNVEDRNLKFDVAVIGGGPAGAIAAISSALQGARTILIEKNGYLGGALTACGTGPQMSYHAGKIQVVRGIPEQVEREMVRRGYSTGHQPDAVGYCSTTTAFDPEGLKIVWEDMAMEAGVTLLYHTVYTGCTVHGGCIEKVRLYAKGGFLNLEAKEFIDASADADLAADAGVPTVYGREGDAVAQPMTMNFHVYGVDRDRLCSFVLANRDDMAAGTPENLKEYRHYDISGAYSRIARSRQKHEYPIDRENVLCFETNTDGEYVVNMTRVKSCSAIDPFDLTRAEIEGRKQVMAAFRFLRENIPGFEKAHLMYSGPEIGIRESRRIVGKYVLTERDLLHNVMFPDAVAMGGYPIDDHTMPVGGSEAFRMKDGSWYSVPYRSLISNEIRNLLVAGRCISATHSACAAIRVTPIVMAVAQGAGTAAAMAAESNCSVQNLDTEKLRIQLRKDGAFLEEYSENENLNERKRI